nr:biopolymer transporter ExbD [Ramlibacter cellulosilyticus]
MIASINTTPLVDVMLVLLIIFLITIPVVNSSIAVNLPREQNQQRDAQQENVIVTVDATGATWWFETRLPDAESLRQLLVKISAMQPQPELHIRGDVRADYDAIGRVVLAAQQAGIARIGFLTEPPPR